MTGIERDRGSHSTAGDTPRVPGPEWFAQLAALDLADRRLRQRLVANHHAPWLLVGGELLGAELHHLGHVDRSADLGTTTAQGVSPQRGSGMPKTATSITAGWVAMAFSNSIGQILKPPEMIMSAARSSR